jgi:hypothetical protein
MAVWAQWAVPATVTPEQTISNWVPEQGWYPLYSFRTMIAEWGGETQVMFLKTNTVRNLSNLTLLFLNNFQTEREQLFSI